MEQSEKELLLQQLADQLNDLGVVGVNMGYALTNEDVLTSMNVGGQAPDVNAAEQLTLSFVDQLGLTPEMHFAQL